MVHPILRLNANGKPNLMRDCLPRFCAYRSSEILTEFRKFFLRNIPSPASIKRRDWRGEWRQERYFAARGLLAKSVAEAARFIAERGVLAEGAPVLVRFIAQIASRFGVVVTQKLAAQAVQVIGALGGAAVNYAFIDHFQEVAGAHFVVRRLERRYGKSAVRAAYETFCCEAAA
jgi:EcsC protein family